MMERSNAMRFFENLLVFRVLDSTNGFARRVVSFLDEDDKRLPPTVIVANRQTAGRGRGTRSWASPVGGLYLTIALPAPPPEERSHLSLTAGLLVVEALREAFGVEALLKWPNDILVGGGKLAGVLVETASGRLSRAETLLFGIGVNLRRDALESFDLGPVASLRETVGREVVADEPLFAILETFGRERASPRSRTAILAAWVDHSIHRFGDPIRVCVGEAGWIEGKFGGLDPTGRLEIETETGIQAIASADVAE